MVVSVALGEADTVRRLGAGDHDLLDTKLRRGLDNVVRRCHIATETLIIGYEHVACIGGEVYDDVWWCFRTAMLVALKVVVRGECVEDLAGVGKVGLESEDAGFRVREVNEVKVEDLESVGSAVSCVCGMSSSRTWCPFLISSGMTCRPAFPEPPVNTIRFPPGAIV